MNFTIFITKNLNRNLKNWKLKEKRKIQKLNVKIIVALKMDSLINDAIKGVILILVILIQVAGPRLKAKFGRR